MAAYFTRIYNCEANAISREVNSFTKYAIINVLLIIKVVSVHDVVNVFSLLFSVIQLWMLQGVDRKM